MKKAVILAGGLSLRMENFNKGMIKCLLPIDGKETILGRINRLLKKNGIEDVVSIIGYKGDLIKKEFENSMRYIEEPFYQKEGMLDSLSYAMDEFNEPFLFMYADSVFSERSLKKIINSNKEEIVCLVSDKEVDNESEKIKIDNGKIIRCSKELPNYSSDGEFTGMIKNNLTGAKKFKEYLQLAKKINLIEHKNVRDFIEFMANGGVAIGAEFVSGEDWMEIDFPKEYKFAKDSFIKQIKEIDKNE